MTRFLGFILTFIYFGCFGQLTTSELPIVIINTDNGTSIPDEPKIQGTMGVINSGNTNAINDPFTDYDGMIGIETRGNSSQLFDKKSYTVQLWSSAGQTTESSLVGLPSDSDWILHSLHIDKSLLRIPMSFYLSQQMGHYATRGKYVELVLNGDYRGVYFLVEKIKQGQDRVNISDMGSDPSGGYILRIDWGDGGNGVSSNYPSLGGPKMDFQYQYPKKSQMTDARKNYIKSYMDNLEDAIFANDFKNASGERYSDLIEMESFVDFLLINELFKNSDGYKLSTFMHKDQDGIDHRLKAGPIWDFDQGLGLSTVCSGHDPCGWTYLQNQTGCEDLTTMPLWWENFTRDSVFCNLMVNRWTNFRSSFLHLDSIYNWIDQQVAVINTAKDRNFTRWPILGEQIWIEPDNFPSDYPGEITYMKDWIKRRLEWMDANITSVYYMSSDPDRVFLYPNPTDDIVNIKIIPGSSVRICDIAGREVWKRTKCTQSSYIIDVSAWANGTYMVYTLSQQGTFSDKLIVK